MDIPLQLSFKDMDRSEHLEAHIRDRVARLERYHNKLMGCRVVVEAPWRSAQGHKPPLGITIEVEVPGHPMVVSREAAERHDTKNDQLTPINRAFEAIQRQLEELSAIRRGEVKHHGNAGSTGRVVRLFPQQQYGFVEVKGSPDLYFTYNAVANGEVAKLVVGAMVHVTIATTEGPMGPQASSIQLLGDMAPPA